VDKQRFARADLGANKGEQNAAEAEATFHGGSI